MKLFKSLGFLLLFSSLLSCSLPAGGQEASTREILVEWSNTSKLSQGETTLKNLKGKRVRSFQTPLMRRKNRGFVEHISLPSDVDVNSVIGQYKKLPGVVTVEPNIRYSIKETSNDSLYTAGSLWGMYGDDNPSQVGPSGTTNQFGSQSEKAWNAGYIGSMRTVVGVIDTGIDYTHPDLYLNIYLNQAEIKPLSFFSSLVDTDSDGLITFRDLNETANAAYVSDLNGNGRIDAGDLLADSRWENGVDNDSNGYVDDLVGWDFINGDNDPFDDNHHGTHVAGTIAGLGGNSIGVAGVNWKGQVMALKFLGEGGYGYLSDAIQAIDYYTSATQTQDKDYSNTSPLLFIGTNNSWGGGGYSSLLKTSIDNGALVNNHFVAAAGNSSSNNDSSPSYPANYSTLAVAGWEAVTSVASLSSSGSLSSFSCFGATTVDLGAPGQGVNSTTPGNNYESFSGTSMATPHVSGSLALFASSFPSANRRELREVLLSTVLPTPSLSGKTATNGRLDTFGGLSELNERYSGGPPTYLVTGPSTANEGTSVTMVITTTNVTTGTTLYWSITGVQPSDISPSPLQGSVSVSGNAASVTFPLVNDNTLEGPETLTFSVFSDSARTSQVGTKSLAIGDTSDGMTYVWGTTARNTLYGTNDPNYITGVPETGVSSAALGRGQIDIVYGKGGADIFLLGQYREGQHRVFYNFGATSSVGSTDYLQIMDFNKLVDKIRLSPSRYFSRNASTNTVIYWDRNDNGTLQLSGSNRDEVIAIVRNVNLGNLTITQGSVPWAIFSN